MCSVGRQPGTRGGVTDGKQKTFWFLPTSFMLCGLGGPLFPISFQLKGDNCPTWSALGFCERQTGCV